jgi:hypothetical protein
MQLPGMSYDPVRLSVDLTWWPDRDDFGVSRQLWTRPNRGDLWVLEDMATSGSPIRLVELPDRWSEVSQASLKFFLDLVHTQGEPFR